MGDLIVLAISCILINNILLAQYLGNSAVVIIPGAGHEIGVVMEGCLDGQIARFFSQASVYDLDFSCVYNYTRPPFVLWSEYENPDGAASRRNFRAGRPSALDASVRPTPKAGKIKK